jgi:hypothetical protein
MFQWSNYFKNIPVPVIPSSTSPGKVWYSPWDVLSETSLIQSLRPELKHLYNLAGSFIAGKPEAFEQAAKKFNEQIFRKTRETVNLKHIGPEVNYNRLQPFRWSKFFLGLGLLLALSSLIGWKKLLSIAGAAFIVLSLVPHTYGITARMIITGRPPVTNLYETFVFVGWMSIILGLVAAHRRIHWFSHADDSG